MRCNEYVSVQSYIYTCFWNSILFYTYRVLECKWQSVILNFSESILDHNKVDDRNGIIVGGDKDDPVWNPVLLLEEIKNGWEEIFIL